MISTQAVILVMFGITHVFIFLAGQWLIDPLNKSIRLHVQSKVLYFCRSVSASQVVLIQAGYVYRTKAKTANSKDISSALFLSFSWNSLPIN